MWGETVLKVVGDRSQKVEWPGYGFYLEVPDGAFPLGMTASVAIKVVAVQAPKKQPADQCHLLDLSQRAIPQRGRGKHPTLSSHQVRGGVLKVQVHNYCQVLP